MREAPPPWWRRALQIAVFAAGAALLVNVLRGADLGAAWSLVARARGLGLLVLLPALVAAVAQTLGWAPVLAHLGHRVRVLVLTRIRLASEAVYLSAPAGSAAADALTATLLHTHEAVPVPDALAALAGRKVLIVGANAVYLVVAFVWGNEALVRASATLGGGAWLAWLVLGGAAFTAASATLLAVAAFSGRLAARLERLLRRLPLGPLRPRLVARAKAFEDTDTQLHRLASIGPAPALAALGAHLVSWLCEAVETAIVLRLVGVSLDFSHVLAIEVLIALLRSLAFVVPSGLGVQDAGYVSLLAAFGVPDAATAGIAFLVIKRAKEVVWIAIGYLLLALPWSRATPTAATAR